MKDLTKPFVLFTLVITLLLLASCNNDDGTIPEKKEEAIEKPKDEPVEEPKEEEPSPEESNKIVEGVIIKGSTKVEGEPPTPNEAINMDLSTAGTDAYLNEGFNIPIVSDADIVGAYIQFKTKDAAISENYYNVNLESNNAYSGKVEKPVVAETFKTSLSSRKPANSILDVDFSSEITPGEFCYLICAYDADGNISAPQEVCVTVNAWGGNVALVGEWHFTKSETYFLNGSSQAFTVGTENCYDDTYICADQATFDYTRCGTKEEETFAFRTDGTYTHTFRSTGSGLDYEASETKCSAVLQDIWLAFTINGNWSYNTEKEQLIVIEYNINYDGTNGPFAETYEPGEAYAFELNNIVVESGVFSYGWPLGSDLNGDGAVNDNDDGGFLSFYKKQ